MSFLQAQAIGNLGRDPEMSYLQDGTAVTKFSIAVNKKVKGKDDVTTWINCVAWRQAGETLNRYLHKGDQIFVQGSLDVRQYTTRDGRNGTSIDLIIDKFAFIGGKKAESATLASDPLGELDDHPF